MNKPASELIALADEAKGILQFAHTEHFSIWQAEAFIEKVELILRRLAVSSDVSVRTAANQSGSERAGVDALLERIVKFEECTTAEPTLRWMIRDYYDARLPMNPGLTADYATRFITGLATPPAQPAPACGGPQLCAGGIEPGFDECPKCGATWEDDCKFDTQSSDGGVEGHAERQVTDDLHLAGREKAKRSDERPSMDHHQVGAKVQSGPQSLKVTSAGIKPGPSEAPSTHGKPDGAVQPFEHHHVLAEWMQKLANVGVPGWSLIDWQSFTDALNSALSRNAAEAPLSLSCDFAQVFPGGKLDDSTYSKIEDTLDKIEAPAQDATGKWLSLHERIAALSPKIAAAETGPGDVIAMKEACKRVASEYKPQYSMPAHEILVMVETRTAIAAAIDRLDVKAEAKSQEPDAVAWPKLLADNWRGRRDTYTGDCVRDSCADELERVAAKHPTTKPDAPAVSVEQLARTIATARGVNPDCLHQNYGDEPVDHEDARGRTFHYGWRNQMHIAMPVAALIAGER